ncbi:hypothetical protein LIER_16589 [Lithospermum erythrorhizon]|uniref:Uncharacterized protein n=1 Tax=Lithospermum erythrorhizon TaxID=34254 RepID=A0AAV3Q795_LITER
MDAILCFYEYCNCGPYSCYLVK